MKTVRINGLVKIASSVRQELSGPVSAERRDVLEKRAKNALQQVDGILQRAGATAAFLAAPSRKAYQFLASLDFQAIECSDAVAAHHRPAGSVSFPGLRRSLQGILDQWNLAIKEGCLEQVYQHICSHSECLERIIQRDSILPQQLSRETREIRGWLAYFAQIEHFEEYAKALQMSTACLAAVARNHPELPKEVFVRFRPMRGVYNLRTYRNVLLVQLPTAMISFDRQNFEILAERAVHRNSPKQAILEAMLEEPYQAVLCELELLGGVTDHSKGIWHDLAESFERVSSTYFNSTLARPRLAWSTVFTSRKLGHYDQPRDTVMISASLDRQDAPEFVIDFIMYHELLHRKLGVPWTNGRRSAHSAEFLRLERQYPDYDQVQIILGKLVGGSCRQPRNGTGPKPPRQAPAATAFVDAKAPRITPPARVGRNAPCPCGSGRKYKKCCGR